MSNFSILNSKNIHQQILFAITFIAIIPIFLIAIPFAGFELAFLLDIDIRNKWFRLSAFILTMTLLTGMSSVFITSLSTAPKTQQLKTTTLDFAITISLLIAVLISYINYHYVTPSSSVLYYLFYDYTRFFFETGTYRPILPSENPSGTWHSMRTYNPSLAASSLVWMTHDKLDNFRSAFGLVSGIVNAGAVALLALISKQYTKYYFPGALIGLLVFYFLWSPGLVQLAAAIGSHDLTLFYFTCFAIAVIVLFPKHAKTLEQYTWVAISLATLSVGVSTRPYLFSAIIACTLVLVTLLWEPRKRHQIQQSFACHKSLLGSMLFISLMLTIIGAYWFFLLIHHYNVPVVYQHSSHFIGISDSPRTLQDLKTILSIIINYDGSVIYVSLLHFSALLISILYLVKNRSWSAPDSGCRLALLFIALCLFLPLLTVTGRVTLAFLSAFTFGSP